MNKLISKLYKDAITQSSSELAEYHKSWDGKSRITFDYETVLYNNFANLIISDCVKSLLSEDCNEKTVDAIWDLEKHGIDISDIINKTK